MSNGMFLLVLIVFGFVILAYFNRRAKNYKDRHPGRDNPIDKWMTGKDDRAFCERVSEALEQGWRLYGSPAMTFDGDSGTIKVAQAVVWKDADVVKQG